MNNSSNTDNYTDKNTCISILLTFQSSVILMAVVLERRLTVYNFIILLRPMCSK